MYTVANIRERPILLGLIKAGHTLAWAFFAGCIVALPVPTLAGRFDIALALIGIVLFECLILALNQWRCPLTSLAARCTEHRPAGFDIYLPPWLARSNKVIFGSFFLVDLAIAGACLVLRKDLMH